jgi:hypothetical protein
MKKISILLAIVLLCNLKQTKAQTYVTVNDTALVNYYQKIIPGAMSGNQLNTSSPLVTTTTHSINISKNENIQNVNSFKYFTSLTYLNCSSCSNIDSLNFLPSTLIYLNVNYATGIISSFLGGGYFIMANLPNSLKYFFCGIPNGFVQTFIPKLPNSLTYLSCQTFQGIGGTEIVFPPLPPSLDTFICSFSQISDLDTLTLPNSLVYLDCQEVFLLDSLRNLPTSLKYLNCGGSGVEHLPALPLSLDTLICYYNRLTSLPALPNTLKYLECGTNSLTSLPALPASLTYLDCGNDLSNRPSNPNNIPNLPALPASLTYLNCNYNSNLAGLPALPNGLLYLDCSGGRIKNLPSMPSGLKTLLCNKDSISCLPILSNNITTFSATGNQFTCYQNYITAMGSNPGYPLCSIGCQPVEQPQICMVTTDSATNYAYNTIIWDKTLFKHVDSMIIFRYDGISSSYLRIGAVSGAALSEFKDDAFNIGGPNGGNPLYASWKYTLQIRDSLGNYGIQSPFHQTMFVQQNGSNFTWNTYTVGIGSSPVTSYTLLRDDNNTGNWQALVNTTSNAATDPAYSSYPNGNWRVDAVGFNCTPSFRLSGNNSIQSTYSKAHSNTTKPEALGIANLTGASQVSVYPNPSNGIFSVETNSTEKKAIQLYDVSGKLVLMQTINGKASIDASRLSEGVYNLNISGDKEVLNKKILIVR